MGRLLCVFRQAVVELRPVLKESLSWSGYQPGALHQLIQRDEQNLELVLRDSLLEPTTTVVEMVTELHRVYSAKNKAYGLFNERR